MADPPNPDGIPTRPGGDLPYRGRGVRELTHVRGNKALEMRMAGATLDAIAERLNFSDRSTARRAIARALRRDDDRLADARAEFRKLNLARYERLISAAWVRALRGNDRAVTTVARLMEGEARLLGLDPPAPVAIPAASSTMLSLIIAELEHLVLDADNVAS